MPTPSFADIFARNLGSLTDAQQQLLQHKRVAVIGCGGLGGYVIEELVRMGVGRLHLFDPDVFAPSNCNRQLNALLSTLGRNKAEVAASRAEGIHPFVAVRAYPADFRALADKEPLRVDAAVDCLDSVEARRDLATLCESRSIPLVHGAVNGWYGQVGVLLPGSDLIDRLYPARMVTGTSPSVLACTVALVASLQAAETVKLLLGLASSLHNTWMHIDLKELDFLVSEPPAAK
jgi:molybdopterin/thiamine biosynthesis adenylyltransferase